MNNTRRLNALLWTINVLLIIGIVAFAFTVFAPSKRHVCDLAPPVSFDLDSRPRECLEVGPLSALPNPLLHSKHDVPGIDVHLIGTDRIAGDLRSDTAYLFIASRKLHVNAYVGEPIRDTGGRDVPEMAGWRLKSITSKGAVFATPQGERSLDLVQGPATVATATPRSDLDLAADLFKDGRIEDACVVFEEALRRHPSSDAVYAFIKRAGEEVLVSMLNSKDGKLKAIGYRLFELAKPGGDRRRTANV